jgi:transmembrane sensor
VSAAAVVLLALWPWQKDAGKPAAVIATGEAQQASRKLQFADGSSAELRGAGSRLETRAESPAGIDVALVAGTARFEVARRVGRRFRVQIDAVSVDVVGTIFTVERLSAGVRVFVERGSVKVISEAREITVTAGATAVVALPAAAGELTREAEKAAPQEPAAEGGSGHEVGAAATIDPPGGHRPPAGKRDDVGALLKASDAARHAGRLEEARELLQRILDHHPRDPRAAYAAFILGRVLLEELRRPREAAAAFARVKSLDPRTPLEQDALAREVESWSRAGEEQRARERAREYLDRFPDGRRREHVRRYSHLE